MGVGDLGMITFVDFARETHLKRSTFFMVSCKVFGCKFTESYLFLPIAFRDLTLITVINNVRIWFPSNILLRYGIHEE
jgi:hypothetical protein